VETANYQGIEAGKVAVEKKNVIPLERPISRVQLRIFI
jgi:hypothetical protein